MNKTYAVVGVSTFEGSCKVRFANDMTRVKVLAKNGHKDIDLVELKHPMTKADAIDYLLKANFDQGNATVRAALEAAQEKRAEKPKKEKKVKTVAAPVATEAVSAPATEDEDAPF